MDENKERLEALEAGRRAKQSLEKARDALESAQGWGILDIFGGGMISTFLKHSKMEDASACIDEAKQDLRRFQQELGDLSIHMDIDLETRDLLGFADWFWDGLLSDWLMQDRINEAKSQVTNAICTIDQILTKL